MITLDGSDIAKKGDKLETSPLGLPGNTAGIRERQTTARQGFLLGIPAPKAMD